MGVVQLFFLRSAPELRLSPVHFIDLFLLVFSWFYQPLQICVLTMSNKDTVWIISLHSASLLPMLACIISTDLSEVV